MKFFDLHIHPALKTMFKEKDNRLSPWHTIKVSDDLFGNALDSQSSLAMIAGVDGMNLICMPIHAPETAMVQQFFLLFGSYFFNEIDHSRLKKMGKSSIDYQTVRLEERDAILTAAPDHMPELKNKKVKLLKSMDEYDPNDKDTIHIVFSVEGAHNFYKPGNDEADINAMVDDVEKLVSEGYIVLYLTPAHLAPNAFLNHAFGIKIFSKKAFLPKGDGLKGLLTPPIPGRKTCYDLLNCLHKHCIPIDVKHMSLKARKEFYEHHQTNYPDRPIFASHVGFTGFSWNNIHVYRSAIDRYLEPGLDYYKISYTRKPGYLELTNFNPSSVNMYDEDLLVVLKSGGLVGMSLDVRIMGADKNKGDGRYDSTGNEYISKHELGEFDKNGEINKTIELKSSHPAVDDEVFILTQEDLMEYQQETADMLELSGKRYEELHLRHFANHILHLCRLRTLHNLPVHPLTQTCIGSDFDGLIQALHCCPDVSALPRFAKTLESKLPEYAAEAGIALDMPASEIVSRLFYENAHNFMVKHYGKIAAKQYHQPGK